MANCGELRFVDGGTHIDTNIVNPNITNPTVSGGTFNGMTMTGGVTLDATTADAFASQLCVPLDTCIADVVARDVPPMLPTEDDFAAAFNTCSGGKHVPGAAIPTCAEMNTAVSTAVNTINERIDNEVDTLNTKIDTSIATVTEGYKAADRLLHEMLGSLDTAYKAADEVLRAYIDETATSLRATDAILGQQISALDAKVDALDRTINDRIDARIPTSDVVDGMRLKEDMCTLRLDTTLNSGEAQYWEVDLCALNFQRPLEQVEDQVQVTNEVSFPQTITGPNRQSVMSGCDGMLWVPELNVYIPFYRTLSDNS